MSRGGRHVIVVTGTPGTGKTLFSKRLAEVLRYEYVDLNGLLIRRRCYTTYDEKRKAYVIDLGRASTIFVKEYDGGRYTVDSHIAHLVVPKELIRMCFVLRASPYELEARLRRKGFNEAKVLENCSAEILDVILGEAIRRYGRDLVAEIDTSGKDVDEVVAEAMAILNGQKRPEIGIVNWLELVRSKGDLSHFLR